MYERRDHHRPGQSLAGATEAQKAEYLPKMARGEALKPITISEPQAISDASNMQLRAERDGDDSVLNGQKT